MNNESREMARTSLSVVGGSLEGMGESFLSCRLYHRAALQGTNIGESGLADAFRDTINLRAA